MVIGQQNLISATETMPLLKVSNDVKGSLN